MPTFHTTSATTSVAGSRDVSQQSDSTGTTVHYTGDITFQGKSLMSPRQLLNHWQALLADFKNYFKNYGNSPRHTAQDREEHLKAQGRVAGYDAAILALTSTATPAAAVTAMEAALNLIAAAAPADGDGRIRADAALAGGEQALAALRRTASVTWVDDD